MDMEWYWALATLIGMVIFFMAMGVPVALTFITTNIIGVIVFMGSMEGWTQIVDNSTSLITRFTLGPVPMFIMMGALFFHTGLAIKVFDGLDVLFGRLQGRLCYLTVAGGEQLGQPLNGERRIQRLDAPIDPLRERPRDELRRGAALGPGLRHLEE